MKKYLELNDPDFVRKRAFLRWISVFTLIYCGWLTEEKSRVCDVTAISGNPKFHRVLPDLRIHERTLYSQIKQPRRP